MYLRDPSWVLEAQRTQNKIQFKEDHKMGDVIRSPRALRILQIGILGNRLAVSLALTPSF